MVIFSASRLNPAWTKGEVPGTQYGLSQNGWINTELFESWFIEHFITNAVSARPLFLLLDGHSTHYQPQVIRFAMEHDVIMLCLPPHTTHESQPLDVGVFAPLKAHWSKVCHEFYQKNPGKVITKFNFSSLFSQAWYAAITPLNIMAGYRRAGVYPLNPEAVLITGESEESRTKLFHSTQSADKALSPSTRSADKALSPSAQSADKALSPSTQSADKALSPSAQSADKALSPSAQLADNSPSLATPSAGPSFTEEEKRRFQIRYEEGFDVVGDKHYTNWLRLYHPNALQEMDNEGVETSELSLAQHFNDVVPLQDISMEASHDTPAAVEGEEEKGKRRSQEKERGTTEEEIGGTCS